VALLSGATIEIVTMFLAIDLLRHAPGLKTKETAGIRYLWDASRKKFLVSTPEEYVRQLLLLELLGLGIPAARTKSEVSLIVGRRRVRADIVVYSKEGKPWLLAECKRPDLPINESVLIQAAHYQTVFMAEYLILTNGPDLLLAKWNGEYWIPLDHIDHLAT
jgi:Type I restriction enzyme R protein N terminus (HSDR_N)